MDENMTFSGPVKNLQGSGKTVRCFHTALTCTSPFNAAHGDHGWWKAYNTNEMRWKVTWGRLRWKTSDACTRSS